jgi:alkanesulfonate monooxygenase SsuD/methylene tetrahydromethanopterin reductase-like flavin-dependent oxidoreductase (luciferase family)
MRFGISRLGPADRLATRDFVQMSEGLGFDAVWASDHPQLGSDAWIQLTMLAGATRTIRLGTLVTCVLYRNPVLLARMVADVDRISGGRIILVVGSGDRPQEFRQMGLPYPPLRERQAALEECLRIIQPLLRGQTVTFQGKHFQADGAVLRSVALQQQVPILIAGGEQTTLRLVAEYGDASNMAAAMLGRGCLYAR